jgi:hypothetical protein
MNHMIFRSVLDPLMMVMFCLLCSYYMNQVVQDPDQSLEKKRNPGTSGVLRALTIPEANLLILPSSGGAFCFLFYFLKKISEPSGLAAFSMLCATERKARQLFHGPKPKQSVPGPENSCRFCCDRPIVSFSILVTNLMITDQWISRTHTLQQMLRLYEHVMQCNARGTN